MEKRNQLANGLGWFSVGLGLAEVIAPNGLAKLIGVPKRPGVMRFYGARELAAGIGILSQTTPAGWMWGRVGGDMLDLASLASALASSDKKGRVALATAAVAGVTALDVICAKALSQNGGTASQEKPRLRAVVTVNRPPEEVYRFWRDLPNLAKFMENIESVQVLDDRRSHWKASGPGGHSVEWDAEIVDDNPNRKLAWRSVGNADVENAGTVWFKPAPGGRGTVVRAEIEFKSPLGWLKAVPEQMVENDLRRFKQVLETGEVMRSDASIHSGPHVAQPPEQVPAELQMA